ncbi:MAG: phosphate ABC transporter permease subunit PstC [Anaerolineales bacterium]|jgi:phosphate transport system permease protein|uniref:phosphate ABC transporter permease subunit PstC n=1 Tax=Candidatus Villigracilis vicinus TaxID=3140679 RepID=UPI003136F234|nr:phosphate ABC transporter permease subunit PstC [Anaerolineales bacterium]
MSEVNLNNTLKTEGRLSRPSTPSRARTNRAAQRTFFIITLVPVVLIIIVATALVMRSYPILNSYSLSDLLLGETWRPNNGEFGFRPFILGTLWVTTVGVLLAVPPCLLVSVYLAEYAHNRTRTFAKPVLDVLAAIPPVVYGVWGLLAIVPFVDDVLAPLSERWLGDSISIFAVTQPTGFGILAGGIVLAVMISPLIISVIFEVLSTVPNDLRHASLAVGATQWQTIRTVVLPQVLPGIVAAIVLGASRALGETIAVLMVVGNVPNIPTSVFDTAYPLPALIANNYGEMMSIPLYDAALLGAALVLLVVILIFNILSTLVLQRFLRRS